MSHLDVVTALRGLQLSIHYLKEHPHDPTARARAEWFLKTDVLQRLRASDDPERLRAYEAALAEVDAARAKVLPARRVLRRPLA